MDKVTQKRAVKPESFLKRRVVKDQDKAGKRDQLIAVAAALLERIEYADVSMDLVAARAGLAKGTLYLYFKTKEELCLEVLKGDYIKWFTGLRNDLEAGKIQSAQQLEAWVIASLKKSPRFLKLLPLGPSILEANVSDAFILDYKVKLAAELQQTAFAMSSAFSKLSPNEAGLLLVQIHIITIGAWSHGFPDPKVKRVIRGNSLHSLDFDYFELLSVTLGSLFSSLESIEPP